MNKYLHTFQFVRYRESAVFLAPPVLGIALSIKHIELMTIQWFVLIAFISAIYIQAVHVFLINDWFDYSRDILDYHKEHLQKRVTLFSASHIATMAVITGLASVLFLLAFSAEAFFIGIILLLLSLIYSSDLVFLHGKGTPGLSTLLHLLGGTFSFLLGYTLYGKITITSVTTGMALGFFLAGGHLIQEIQDAEGDKLNHLNTTKNLLGEKATLGFAIMYLAIGHGLMHYLMKTGFLPNLLWLNSITLTLVIITILFSLRKGWNYINIGKIRNKYRIVYAIFGVAIILEVLNKTHI